MKLHDAREGEPLLRAIVATPGDAMPRVMFADWLEERGYDREAAGQRWAAEAGFRVVQERGGVGVQAFERVPGRPELMPAVMRANLRVLMDARAGGTNPLAAELAFLTAGVFVTESP